LPFFMSKKTAAQEIRILLMQNEQLYMNKNLFKKLVS